MKSGDIVLTIIPQDNQKKIRPVLILKNLPGYNDFLVCAVSTQLHQFIKGFDILPDTNDPAFTGTGLKASSLFRLSNLAVLQREEIIGTIGILKTELHRELLKNLSAYLIAE